ncbi:tetratricopeptide repeat protein [Phocaeicola plebeius]|uniref:CDC27 family protein n=1 Tax=Phocaeicola plebeius TaxID=310297 RepID=A0A921HKV8_9BACT|nr:CDC27 family protein [Phocaeicola plebeius]HJF82229.1 CDC27 family protein [Phocaeicola plebeius]
MKKKYIFPLLALCFTSNAFSQTLSQAQKWFTEGKFAEAKPVFEKLVRQAPSNANYNFWYGACCYETGELSKAVPYLEKSAERKVINGFLYLSKAYYDLYRFDEAIQNLEDHIYWLERKKRDTSEAETLMERYRMGARMIRGVEKVAVIDSFTVSKRDFLSAYKLSRESGEIKATGESGCTEFTNEMGDKKILARPNADGATSLYGSVKMIDKWSDPEPLKGLEEGGTNLNYPFLDSDGITLYYAAQGEESLGGYDIFITRYDSDDNAYLRPDNLGFPFNSVANDYMYAIDDFNNLGWFASDRYQPEDKVCVYVFVPNESKQVYDYESTSPEMLQAAASLQCIQKTQTDAAKVRLARQQLAKVMYGQDEQKKKGDFRFVVDDNVVYHTLADFRSAEARKQYQTLSQKQKDLDNLSETLGKQRELYGQSNKAGKDRLTPAILDKEQRIKQLREEIASLTVNIRNTELKALNRK